MNEISWLIYLSHIFGALNAVGALFIFAAMGYCFYCFVKYDKIDELWGHIKVYGSTILIVGIMIMTIVPDKNTILLIALSEAGENIGGYMIDQDMIDIEAVKDGLIKKGDK